jgi:hypothetical protein
MKRLLCALFIMSVVAVSGLSADTAVDGLWIGEVQSDSSTQAVRLELVTIEGAHIGGGFMLPSSEIGVREGLLDRNTLTFVTYQDNQSTATKFTWTGVINGDEMNLSCRSDDANVPPVQFVVHRQP